MEDEGTLPPLTHPLPSGEGVPPKKKQAPHGNSPRRSERGFRRLADAKTGKPISGQVVNLPSGRPVSVQTKEGQAELARRRAAREAGR